jgi:uncharacterized caspase-like protein
MRDIDQIIAKVRTALPHVSIEQLKVAHPGADDDGIWFFSSPAGIEVQLESSTGNCPFIIERSTSPEAITSTTIEHAVQTLLSGLGT